MVPQATKPKSRSRSADLMEAMAEMKVERKRRRPVKRVS